jgi:hypothetical protein
MKQFVFSFIFILLTVNMQAQKKKLYGSWKASNGAITTFTDQTMTMAGTTYYYTVQKNYIMVYNDYGQSMQYKYQVKGNKLYLYVKGAGSYVLKKVKRNKKTGYGKQVNSAANARLYGSFCTYSSSGYSGSSSYSTTKTVSFDGQGHYSYGSQSSYSGGGDGYSGGNGGYTGTYKVVGNQGVILTASDGSVYKVAIHFVQNSGEITELKYDGVVYGKSLCD